MFVCRSELKEKEKMKKIKLQLKNIKKRIKIDIALQNFIFIAQIRFTSPNTLLIY
jgi:hypothetical protein